MASTTTVTPTPATSSLWHGLVALGHHMQQHGLSDFGELDVEEHQLIVHLAEATAHAWQTSIAVDTIDVDDAPTGFREWVTVTGRLPDTGVRIVLSWPRSKQPRTTVQEPAPLAQAVAEVVSQFDTGQLATCEHCGQELGVGMPTHGAERGETLCSDCCHASNPCSHRACCDEGATR